MIKHQIQVVYDPSTDEVKVKENASIEVPDEVYPLIALEEENKYQWQYLDGGEWKPFKYDGN